MKITPTIERIIPNMSRSDMHATLNRAWLIAEHLMRETGIETAAARDLQRAIERMEEVYFPRQAL